MTTPLTTQPLTTRPTPGWNPIAGPGRARSLLRFVLAAIWFTVVMAVTAGDGFNQGDFSELINRTVLLLLLVVVYGLMGKALDGQAKPLVAMGLGRRPGWGREWAMGAAFGWAAVVAVVVPMALAGALHVQFWTEPRAFWLMGINLPLLAVAALAEEVAFRGYPFQRLIEVLGPTGATLLLAVVFGLEHAANPAATPASVAMTMLAGVLLSLAYLRTRALWLPWGLHFAWNVSMGVLFGLPVSGMLKFSTVIQTRALGPHWLTGGSYGPEASVVAGVVLAVALIVILPVTRDYAWQYTAPVIVSGGMAVEIKPPAAHAAMEAAAPPAGTTLVQIAPMPPAATAPMAPAATAPMLTQPTDLPTPPSEQGN